MADLSRPPLPGKALAILLWGGFHTSRPETRGSRAPPRPSTRPRRAIRGDFLPLETPQARGHGKFSKSPNPPVPPSVVVFSPLELRALGLVQLKNSAPLSKSTFPALPPTAPPHRRQPTERGRSVRAWRGRALSPAPSPGTTGSSRFFPPLFSFSVASFRPALCEVCGTLQMSP